MISIFRDGYGILPSTILVPHLNAYQSDKHLHDNTDIELSKNQPNLILTDDNIILKNQDKLSDDSLAYTHEIFKKLFKKNDDTQEINSTDTTNIFVQTFSQLAEKRIYKQIETDYYNFLTKREEKIRTEQERLQKLDEYNQKLADRAIESKIKEAEKKKQKERNLEYFKGLLAGDKDDPSILKLILSTLNTIQAEFFKIWHLKTHTINNIERILPIILGYGTGYYRSQPTISVIPRVRPRKQIIFSSIYRTWFQQFVRKIIEKRQRGPPLIIIIIFA